MSKKKQIRAAFRSAVFRRDGYRCAVCGKLGKDRQGGDAHRIYHPDTPDEYLLPLDAHHITDRNDMPNGGYVVENGISLCDDGCHLLAEAYHQTGVSPPGFTPTDLYARIGSSWEEALRTSEKLG